MLREDKSIRMVIVPVSAGERINNKSTGYGNHGVIALMALDEAGNFK